MYAIGASFSCLGGTFQVFDPALVGRRAGVVQGLARFLVGRLCRLFVALRLFIFGPDLGFLVPRLGYGLFRLGDTRFGFGNARLFTRGALALALGLALGVRDLPVGLG